LLYDTLLIFPHEIELLWRGKFGLAALLYSLARYSTILVFLFNLALEFASISLQVHIFHLVFILHLFPPLIQSFTLVCHQIHPEPAVLCVNIGLAQAFSIFWMP
jgi:hypothetical protein